MGARGHVPIGRLRLIEGKYLIEHRLEAVRRDRTVHRLEHCIEPTEMPCTLARRAKISPGLSSVAGPLRPPIMLILPPTRMAPNERANVAAPPTSTTWSTPRPPVIFWAAFSQSGVVT